MTLERLHKVMAAAGAGSRRECERLIVEGRVVVDGAVVRELGTKVDPETCDIRFDGERLKPAGLVYYMVNKPRHIISTCRDEMGRPGVVDLVPETPKRIYPVGRLDADSVGLVLLTNDGALAQRLTHPRFEIMKTYEVRVRGAVGDGSLERLRKGVWLSDGRARVEGCEIRRRRPTVTDLLVTLHEGKNREIRRVFARLGHPVLQLKRLSIGTLRLGSLKEGHHRKLTPAEVDELRRSCAAAAPVADGRKDKGERSNVRGRRRKVAGRR
jgi:23S rRNA pseudouridine2605 synthase